jgi:hypothetical protein
VGFGPPLFFVDSLRESRYTELEEIHMTILELIERLNALYAREGNLDVVVTDEALSPLAGFCAPMPSCLYVDMQGRLIDETNPATEECQKVVWL